jgi:protein phosphatase
VTILEIPSSALVLLIGIAGSGKSTFARSHFLRTEVLSSDYFRGLVSDDEANQDATGDAFELLHSALEKRLRRGKLCVIDATNVVAADRLRLLAHARHFGRAAVAIIFEIDERVASERAGSRADRTVPAEIVKRQLASLKLSLADIEREGFDKIFTLPETGEIQIRRLDC